MRKYMVIAGILSGVLMANAQLPQSPGKEHELLKAREGDWEIASDAKGIKGSGVVTYKMELGGMWLVGHTDCKFGELKYSIRTFESYDADRKKYVSTSFDSISGAPQFFEGEFDAAKKTLTMTGMGSGADGKPTKQKSVTHMLDADSMRITLYAGESKEPEYTMSFKRKK